DVAHHPAAAGADERDPTGGRRGPRRRATDLAAAATGAAERLPRPIGADQRERLVGAVFLGMTAGHRRSFPRRRADPGSGDGTLPPTGPAIWRVRQVGGRDVGGGGTPARLDLAAGTRLGWRTQGASLYGHLAGPSSRRPGCRRRVNARPT